MTAPDIVNVPVISFKPSLKNVEPYYHMDILLNTQKDA